METEQKASPLSGEDLYRRLMDGDRDAMEGIVDLYNDGMMLFIQNIVRNPHDAEEIVIDAFAKLVLGGYRGRASLKTYLYAIARNLALRHLKRNKHKEHYSLEDVLERTDTEIDGRPESNLFRDERKRQLLTAVQKLKPEYRDTLHLLYFEDMSYAEAGRVLGKNEKQIADLTYRAKTALKKTLESEGFTYEES